MPDTEQGFDPVRQLTRGHVQFSGELLILKAT